MQPALHIKFRYFILICLLSGNALYAQYVQIGPPLCDKTAPGTNQQAQNVIIAANGQMAIAGYPNRQSYCGGFNIYQRTGSQWSSVFSYTGNTGSAMGEQLAISGDGSTVAVYGFQQNGDGTDSIWVFMRNGNTWLMQATFPPNEPLSDEIYIDMSYDGNTLTTSNSVWVRTNNSWSLQQIVLPSAYPNSNYMRLSGDGNTILANSDTIFVRIGKKWKQQAKFQVIVPGDTAEALLNYFPNGQISADGNTASVNFTSEHKSGTATFRRIGSNWIQDTAFAPCTFAVLSADGNTLTAMYNSSRTTLGLINYHYNGTGWLPDSTSTGLNIEPSSGYEDEGYNSSNDPELLLQYSVDSSASHALFSNSFTDTVYGGISYFTFAGSTWALTGPRIIDNPVPCNGTQGLSAVISSDGNTLAYDGVKNNFGAVWVYTHSGYSWTKQVILQCPDGNTYDRHFGSIDGTSGYSVLHSLGLSADGNILAVAAAQDSGYLGSVYLFQRTGNNWNYQGKVTIPDTTNNGLVIMGTSIAISADGKTLIAGSRYGSGAYVFYNNNGTWQLQGNLYVSLGQGSGKVALSADGNTAVITEEQYNNYQGAFHIFTRSGNTWSLKSCCHAPFSSGLWSYPSALAFSANGKYIAASDAINSDTANVYAYNDSSFSWSYGLTRGAYNPGMDLWLSPTGDTLVQLANGPGNYGSNSIIAINIWVQQGLGWKQIYQLPYPYQADHASGSYNSTGYSQIGVSGDMKYIVQGLPSNNYFDGGVYIYQKSDLNVAIADSVPPGCAGISNGKLKINITGGAAPVNINWSTGASGVDSIDNLAAGTYSVSITDADSVQVVRTYALGAANTLSLNKLDWFLPCAGINGWVTATVSGGQKPYTYQWNTTPLQSTDTAIITQAGTYMVTITEAGGCTLSDSVVANFTNYWTDVSAIQPNCDSNGSASVVFYGGVGNTSYKWSNGSTQAVDQFLGPGAYSVTVTDSLGCSAAGSTTLYPFCGNVIQGQVYYDNNLNCVFDSGDVAGVFNVYATNGAYYAFGNTDSAGNFQIIVPTAGTFQVSLYTSGDCGFKLCSTTPYPQQAVFASTGDTATFSFPVINTVYDLTVWGSAPVCNPGFNETVTIYYGNLAGRVAGPATVTLNYDPSMTFNSAAQGGTNNAGTVSWNVGDVQPTGGNFTNTQYVQANFTVSTSATGPFIPLSCTISAPGTDCNLANNSLTFNVPFAGAIDPNEKTSSLSDSTETYTIYFQNTGTDSTHFVVVSDTLSPDLNPASIQTLATSNGKYNFQLAGSGIATWRFDPYFLPDSSTDPVNSKGYITFSVKLKSGTAQGTAISNTAYIYFDYNNAVVTNTVTDTFGTAAQNCTPNGSSLSQSICQGDTFYIGNKAYYSAGNFADTLQNAGGCDSVVALSLTIDYASVKIEIMNGSFACDSVGNDNYLCGRFTFLVPEFSDAVDSFRWYIREVSSGMDTTLYNLDTLKLDVQNDSMYSFPQPTLYINNGEPYLICVTAFNHCGIFSICDTVVVWVDGIESINVGNALSLYPNPTNSLLYIKTEGLHPENILIYDVAGQLVAKQTFTPEIDVHSLTNGVYLLEITSKEGVARKRWVKM